MESKCFTPSDDTVVGDELLLDIETHLAVAKGVDPVDLGSLYDVLDVEALEAMVGWSAETLTLTLEYEEYTVNGRGDGHVRVDYRIRHSSRRL